MEKTKLAQGWCDKKPGHKMTKGTDFDQFYAACELNFCVLLNAALEYIILKNVILEFIKK
jgi:hypothetical protein